MESLIAWVFVIITLWMIFNRRRDGLSRRFPGGPVPPLPPRVPEEGDDLWVEPQREKRRYGAEPAGGDPPGGYRSRGEGEGDLPLPGPWNGGREEADRPLPGPWNRDDAPVAGPWSRDKSPVPGPWSAPEEGPLPGPWHKREEKLPPVEGEDGPPPGRPGEREGPAGLDRPEQREPRRHRKTHRQVERVAEKWEIHHQALSRAAGDGGAPEPACPAPAAVKGRRAYPLLTPHNLAAAVLLSEVLDHRGGRQARRVR